MGVDILSAACVLVFLVVPWWQLIQLLQDGSDALMRPSHLDLPLMILYTMDFLPFIVGLYWLYHRYELTVAERCPIFFNCGLHNVAILILIVAPHLLIGLR
jgi:hypothetical protein